MLKAKIVQLKNEKTKTVKVSMAQRKLDKLKEKQNKESWD